MRDETPATPYATDRGAVRVGIDLGTHRTVLSAARGGSRMEIAKDVFRTVIGLRRLDVPHDVLRQLADVLFSEDAIAYRTYLDVRRPLVGGIVRDVELCQLFARHICGPLARAGETMWGVVSAPATATDEERANVGEAFQGVLDRVGVVPEPWLAAIGELRRRGLRGAANRGDLSLHAVVIDVGAESTRLDVLLGDFPRIAAHAQLDHAGNALEQTILEEACLFQSGLQLSRELVRGIKEEQARVTAFGSKASLGDPSDLVGLAAVIQGCCDRLLKDIVGALLEVLEQAGSAAVVEAVRNVVVTGGGSRIRGLADMIAHHLVTKGYADARARAAQDYKRRAAEGALYVAETLSEEQWSALTGSAETLGEPLAAR